MDLLQIGGLGTVPGLFAVLTWFSALLGILRVLKTDAAEHLV